MRKGVRELKRTFINEEGMNVAQKVTIGLKDATETLTTTEGKMYYLFLQLWDQQGRRPDGNTFSSLHRLFNNLMTSEGPKPKQTRRGNWSKVWFLDHLKRMMSVPIVYEQSYKNKDGTYRKYESFTLISSADVFERNFTIHPNQKFFDFSRFTLHPVIVRSLTEKNIKLVRADVLLTLRGELSIILYRFLELVLFDKPDYERNIVDLAKELDFGAARTDHLLHQFRDACAELEGKDLSHGRIDVCEVKKTVDKRNWKIVVRKGRQRPAIPSAEMPPTTITHNPDAAEETTLLAIFDSFSDDEKQKVKANADEIFQAKYGIGGERTRRYALLDAIVAYDTERKKTE